MPAILVRKKKFSGKD